LGQFSPPPNGDLVNKKPNKTANQEPIARQIRCKVRGILMAASLFVLATLGSAALSSIQDPKLELDFPGGTLTTLAKEIETQTGWKLTVHPDVANDVVVVYSNGKDSTEILKQLAKVTATTWTLDGDQMQVLPDINVRQRQSQEALQKYAAELTKARQEYLNSMVKRKIKDEDGEEYEYEPELEQRILASLIANVPIQTLTNLRPGGRIVLSSNPNRAQVALGRFNAQDVQLWINQHNEMVKTMNESEFDNEEIEGIDPELLKMMGEAQKPQEIKEAPAKMLLVLSRSRGFGMFGGGNKSIQITAKVIGQSGKTLLQTMTSIGAGYSGMFEAAVAVSSGEQISIPTRPGDDEPPPKAKLPGDDLKIAFSEETKLVKEALRMDFNPESTKLTMTKKIRDILMRPDLYEPMRYELGDGLVAAAKALKKPVIASLPDEIFSFSDKMPETVGEFRETLNIHSVVQSDEDGWWTVVPKEPTDVRATRVSRVALAEMLAIGQNRMFLPLDPIANFVYQNPDAAENAVASTVLRMFAPHIFMTMFGGNTSTDHLRLYGSLNSGQRKAVRNGTPLQVAQMTQSTRSIVDMLVFGADGRISAINPESVLEPVSVAKLMQDSFGMGMSMYGGGMNGEEPTEAFPNGLPPAGRLAMKAHTTQYLVAVSADGSPMKSNMPFGRMELAMWGMLSKNPTFLAELGNMDHYFRNMRAGNRTELKFAMFLTPNLGFNGELLDIEEPDKSRKYSIYDLPPGLKEQVAGDIVELEASPFGKMMQMMGEGGFGGAPPVIKP